MTISYPYQNINARLIRLSGHLPSRRITERIVFWSGCMYRIIDRISTSGFIEAFYRLISHRWPVCELIAARDFRPAETKGVWTIIKQKTTASRKYYRFKSYFASYTPNIGQIFYQPINKLALSRLLIAAGGRRDGLLIRWE
jgi:hypothetical protein